MRDPAAALKAARRAAASAPERDEQEWIDVEMEAPNQLRRLAQWAIIAPDDGLVYSTRRLGQPITGVKRLLIHLLRQYIDQLGSQQSRFNAQLAAHMVGLEERVRELEAALDAVRNGGGDTTAVGPRAGEDTAPPAHRAGDTTPE